MADTLQAVREAYAEARLDYPNQLAWEELSLEMHEALIHVYRTGRGDKRLGPFNAHGWDSTELSSVSDALQVLLKLQGKRWLSRGQPQHWGGLVPSIDRDPLQQLTRAEKLVRERQSIDQFRSTARVFSNPGEQKAQINDIVALMVLRHYGVPTRLLDWSLSPFVAAYFAAEQNEQDGEIWTFSYQDYVIEGKEQWVKWKEDTTTDRTGADIQFDAQLSSFRADDPPPWIVAAFYGEGFHRQNAQSGFYTMTSRFGIDHADALRTLLRYDQSRFHRYVIKKDVKPDLRTALREDHGIWQGSLFPDAAGAAHTVKLKVFG